MKAKVLVLKYLELFHFFGPLPIQLLFTLLPIPHFLKPPHLNPEFHGAGGDRLVILVAASVVVASDGRVLALEDGWCYLMDVFLDLIKLKHKVFLANGLLIIKFLP